MFEPLGTPDFVKEIRGGWMRPFSLVKVLFSFLLLYVVGNVLQSLLLTPVLVVLFLSNEELLSVLSDSTAIADGRLEEITERMLRTDVVLVATLFATVAVILCATVYCRAIEKRSFFSMGVRKKGALGSALIGAALALAVLLLTLLFAMVFGGVSVIGASNVRLPLLLLLTVGFALQGFAEAALYFGCLMTSLARGRTLFFSMTFSAFAFAFFHRAGAGATPLAFLNFFLLGLLMALCMIRTGSLFGAAALGAFFSIGEGVLLGSPVSGEAYSTSVLALALGDGKTLLHGGLFGIEGGLAFTFALTLALALLAMRKTKETE